MKNLYFIPKIFKAIGNLNPYHELENAFKEIVSLGSQEQYRQGFAQFVRFMEALHDYIHDEDQCLDLIRSADAPPQPGIDIVIERNGACLAEITYRYMRTMRTIKKVAPGKFVLKLKIGRVIWSGELTKEDLIWTEAFPGDELRLAAKTERASKMVSRTVRVFNDEIILQVIPGIEHGNIDILFKGAKIG